MPRFLYTLVYTMLLPLMLLQLWWRGFRYPAYRQGWLQRLGFVSTRQKRKPLIWVHAVSVGESIAAKPLVDALLVQYPDLSVWVTNNTPTGAERTRALFSQELGRRVFQSFVPYDLPSCLKRFLKSIQPQALFVMETEIWPNTVNLCAQQNIPVVLINGRLSEKSCRGYQKVAALMRPAFGNIAMVLAQHTADKERFQQVGAKNTQVTGNIKLDIVLSETHKSAASQYRARWPKRLVMIGASTHDTEEALILKAFECLKAKYPELLLVVVPRHPQRFDAVEALCKERLLSVARLSEQQPVDSDISVVIGDQMGELLNLYGASDIAMMGGTWIDHGGHNFLEPAIWSLPIISGLSTYNFAAISQALLETGGLLQAKSQPDLQACMESLINNASLRKQAGDSAKHYVEMNRGAIKNTMAFLEPLIKP